MLRGAGELRDACWLGGSWVRGPGGGLQGRAAAATKTGARLTDKTAKCTCQRQRRCALVAHPPSLQVFRAAAGTLHTYLNLYRPGEQDFHVHFTSLSVPS